MKSIQDLEDANTPATAKKLDDFQTVFTNIHNYLNPNNNIMQNNNNNNI